MQLNLTLELTEENLDKLKVFCDGHTHFVPVENVPEKKSAPKAKAKTAAAPASEPQEVPAPAQAKSAAAAPDAEAEKKKITKNDVRAVALKLSKSGKADALKEIFAKYDATKLSEIKEADYPAVLEDMEAVNA